MHSHKGDCQLLSGSFRVPFGESVTLTLPDDIQLLGQHQHSSNGLVVNYAEHRVVGEDGEPVVKNRQRKFWWVDDGTELDTGAGGAGYGHARFLGAMCGPNGANYQCWEACEETQEEAEERVTNAAIKKLMGKLGF